MPPTRWGTNKTKILFGWACRPAGRRPLVRVSAPAGPPCGAGGPLSAPPRPWVGWCCGARLGRPRRATPGGASLAWGWSDIGCSMGVSCLAAAASGPCCRSIDQPRHIKARAVVHAARCAPAYPPGKQERHGPQPCLSLTSIPSPIQLLRPYFARYSW